MNIAFLIISLKSGGAERATSSLANYISSQGHNVSIITISGNDSFYNLDENVNKLFLDLSELPKIKGISRIAASAKRAISLRKSVQKLKPDVLIGMSNIMTAYAIFCTKFSKIKAIGTERNNPFVYLASPAMTLLRKTCCFLCDGFIHQTKRAQAFFPKSTYKKSSVIPNAVFNPLVPKIFICNNRTKEITAMGRLVKDKGFDILISAFNAIRDKISEYRLVIFGTGELEEDLLASIKALGLEERIILAGAREDALLDVAKSSLFVLSSRIEGMPNVLMEAMASGVPCVSTRCPMGPEELIVDGENGLLVPVDDADALAQAILNVLTDVQLSQKLAQNSFELRETHSIDKIGTQWIEYCKKVAHIAPE